MSAFKNTSAFLPRLAARQRERCFAPGDAGKDHVECEWKAGLWELEEQNNP